MRAPQRAYRDMQIVLARAGGATYPQISQRFKVSERQVARIIRRFRQSSEAADFDRAYQLARWRLETIHHQLTAVNQAAKALGPLAAFSLVDKVLPLIREAREVEELLGLLPRRIDWTFGTGASMALWEVFSDVLKRHGCSEEVYWELREEFREWARWYRSLRP